MNRQPALVRHALGPLGLAAVPAAAAGVAFLANILMSRLLGPAGRGVVGGALQIAYVVGPLLVLGLDLALLRGEYRTLGFRVLLRRPLWISLSLLALTAAIGLVIPPVNAVTIGLAVIAAFGFASLTLLRSWAIGRGVTPLYLRAAFLFQSFLGSAALLLAHYGVRQPVMWLLPYLAPAAIAAIYALRPRRGLRIPSRLVRQGLTHAPGQMATILLNRMDRLLLIALAGPASLGLYLAVATFLESGGWLARGVADWRVRRMVSETQKRSVMAKSAAEATVTIVGYGVLAVVLNITLVPLFGSSFEAARDLILPLALAGAAFSMAQLLRGRQVASNRSGLATRPAIVALPAALLLYPIAVIRWEAQGAAWASMIVYSVQVAASAWFLRRTSGGS